VPFLLPNHIKALKGKSITFHGLDYTKLAWGLPTLSLTKKGAWLPWGGLPSFSSALDANAPDEMLQNVRI